MANFTTSNYEYITNSQASIIESDILEKLSIIQDNLLNFKTVFEGGDWARGELERIARELESVSKSFLDQQGINETYTLRNGIHAEVWGNKIDFYNNARNSRGQFYAGHIEYGHYNRNGTFTPAFPFMRPALFAVSKASQGEFSNILAELAQATFQTNGIGYQGLQNIRFGKELGKAHSYSLPSNITLNRMKTSSGSRSNRFIDEIFHDKFREGFSVRRNRFDKQTSKRKESEGWNSSKNGFSSGRNTLKQKQYFVNRKYQRKIVQHRNKIAEYKKEEIRTRNLNEYEKNQQQINKKLNNILKEKKQEQANEGKKQKTSVSKKNRISSGRKYRGFFSY